jgi:hypothetical protein
VKVGLQREVRVIGSALLLPLLLAPTPKAKEVTAEEKAAFLQLLTTLESGGEFFTEEAVKKAAPHTRVLLSLTAKDIEKYDVYPFLALSRSLCELKEPREYAVKHFGKIAHPIMRVFWAIILFDAKAASPEIVKFLRAALANEKAAEFISGMVGPEFEDFKKRVKDYPLKEK